ncbi:MAG TPA: hypothetical protein VL461_12310 [Dictyobacter sp.]|nr:hypothetical protein [Dictyobacter sp.]
MPYVIIFGGVAVGVGLFAIVFVVVNRRQKSPHLDPALNLPFASKLADSPRPHIYLVYEHGATFTPEEQIKLEKLRLLVENKQISESL